MGYQKKSQLVKQSSHFIDATRDVYIVTPTIYHQHPQQAAARDGSSSDNNSTL